MARMMAEADWHYPAELPVVECRPAILEALRHHDVVVVVSETGSGKTTQLPKMVAEVLQEIYADKMRLVGVTQPRRIAAVSVARRVAEEIKVPLGDYVGYQVRFDEKRSAATRIKFMTDGILLAETQGDPSLKNYDAIILDEAHERSLNIDFLLGYLRDLRQRRPNLKIVISSATLDAGAFAEFFRSSDTPVPIIVSAGRTFPVDERFLPPWEDEEWTQHIARAVDDLSRTDPTGDILIFLPGEREIRECADILDGRNWPRTEVLPLFARLGIAEQQRIFSPGSLRRIILATHVAETSLTIPRITSVIDTGLARISRWSAARGVQRLLVEPISKASARQRKGRCGRVKAGICIRLYSAEDFEERPEFTDPEIRRSSLAGVILRMISLGLPDIDAFPLIDPPTPKAVAEGYRSLREVGAITKDRKLTDDGAQMSRMPVDPRLARMLLAARQENCLYELLPVIASLESQDPRERPAEKIAAADAAHARWKNNSSDFLSILHIWLDLARFREKNGNWRRNALRKFCAQHFLSFRRVLEWANVHDELRELLTRDLRWQIPPPRISPPTDAQPASPVASFPALHDPFHRAILAGVPRQFALWDLQEKTYRIASGGTCALFPGSTLFGGKRHDWLLVMEVVETSRLYARRAAHLDPAWVEQVAPHLCSYRYSHGAWDPAQGAVYARETVLCAGMVLAKDRRVHLGRIDPAAAREVFIREALILDGITAPCPSLQTLRALHDEVKALEIKLRRPEHFWSEEKIFAFFDAHIPPDLCTAKAFHQWRAQHEATITPTLADVVWDIDALGLVDDFPDTLSHQGEEYSIYYAMQPGAADDGVTIGVHIDQLQNFPDHLAEWGVPGHLAHRVEFLVRHMPKEFRKACQPITSFVDDFCDLWARAPKTQSLRTALADAVRARVRFHVPESDIELAALPAEHQVKCWICDDDGQELAIGTDVSQLREKLQPYLRERLIEHANADWQSSGHTTWPIDLPTHVPSTGGIAYPGLIDEGKSVGVTANHCPATAAFHHRLGCARLLMLAQPDQVAYLTKNFPIGLAARVELPRLGADGTTLEQLILLTAQGSLGTMPRTAADFAAIAQKARGDWHESAKPLGQALDAIVSTVPALRTWCQAQNKHPHLAEIAHDEEQHLAWLLRKSFVLRATHATLRDYPRYLRGIQVRLDRLKSLPIVKDLEKMDRVHQLWQPWHKAWTNAPENPSLWEIGWQLEEYRLSLLSPGVPTKGTISEKKLRDLISPL